MVLLLIALTVAACGGESTSPTTAAPVMSSPSVSTTAGGATTTAAAATTSSTDAPPPPVGAELLVANPDGVFRINPDGTADQLIAGPAAFAIDDLDGGVLFQQEQFARDRASVVYRVRRGSGEAAAMLIPQMSQGLVLAGVARDGDTYAYYTRNEGSTPDDARETLRRYNLTSREVSELEVTGGWEASSFPVSVSSSLILLNWSAEASHGMRFIDLQANEAAVAADPDEPEGSFTDCGICPSLGELSADGEQLVYLETVDGVHYAVIRHVASGAEIRRIDLNLPGDDWRVVSFDLSAQHLVVNGVEQDEELDGARIYNLSMVDPQPLYLSIVGTAYLTRSPVDIEAVVPAP